MEKILLSLGTFAAVAAPVATVIACGGNTEAEKSYQDYETNLKFEDGHSFDKKEFVDGGDITIDNLIKQIGNSKVYSINRNHEVKASLVKKEDMLEFIRKFLHQYHESLVVKSETMLTISVNNLTVLNDSSKSTTDILKECIKVEREERALSEKEDHEMAYIDFYRGAFIFGGEFIENHMRESRRGESIKQLEAIISGKNVPVLDISKELNLD